MKIEKRDVNDNRARGQTLAERLDAVEAEVAAAGGGKTRTPEAASRDARNAEIYRINTRILDAALTDDRVVDAFRKGSGGVSAPICTRPLCLDYRMLLTGSDKVILAFLRENYENFDGRVRSLEEHRIRLYFQSIFDQNKLMTMTLPSGVKRNLYKVLGHKFILQRIVAMAQAQSMASKSHRTA